jgi:hypothetical protein
MTLPPVLWCDVLQSVRAAAGTSLAASQACVKALRDRCAQQDAAALLVRTTAYMQQRTGSSIKAPAYRRYRNFCFMGGDAMWPAQLSATAGCVKASSSALFSHTTP